MEIAYTPGKEPHPLEHRLIFRNIDRVGWDTSLDCYLQDGGYDDLKKALGMPTADIIKHVQQSGLRGRGGAGFPTGVKWTFIPKNIKWFASAEEKAASVAKDQADASLPVPAKDKFVYLVCNCDESEPGTFKDRYIVHQDPHQLIEGLAIASFAVGSHLSFIYMREEFPEGARIMEQALQEARERGFIGKNICGSGYDLEVYVHRGAGAYICGEETALIESIEGKRPYPRIKPPFFPAAIGLYQCPTIVNNVESLCHVKHIIRMGGEEYSRLGTPRNNGTRIIGVSGDVKKPGYYEIESGKITFRQLLFDMCGGPKEARTFKAVIPGGSSAKIMRCDETYSLKQPDGSVKELEFWDVPLDFDTVAACGSMAGSGGVIVMDDSRRMSWVINNLNHFYAHESCGQCTPCREGNPWMKKITDRIVAGEAAPEEIDLLDSIARNIDGKTICAFGEGSSWPVEGMIDKFRDELLADTRPENAAKPHSKEAIAQYAFINK